MPKAPMTAEEFEIVRARILDTALDIIIREGFHSLSIRKIAGRLGVTATTIYNYFINKDELNLMIRIRGFETLYAMLKQAFAKQDDLAAAMEEMIRAYIQFGLTYPEYYDLMFNLNTPKYLDYVGTDMEATAFFEKQTALKCFDMFVTPLQDYVTEEDPDTFQFVRRKVIQFWSDLHGLIALYNSRLFHEVITNVEAFIEERIETAVREINRLKQQIDQGVSLTAMD